MTNSKTENLDKLRWDVVPLSEFLPQFNSQIHTLNGSMTQRPAWVSNWQRTVNPDVFCVVVRSDARIELVVSLEVIKKGPLKIAIFPGGSHANENFACASSTLIDVKPEKFVAQLTSVVKSARTDIDAIYLHRQVQFHDGLTNPFLVPTQATETDIALSLQLNEDFQLVLQSRDGGKKQKKIRQSARRMEERGGWTYAIAKNPADIESSLQAFYDLKAVRLASKGIANVFGPAEIKNFITQIFVDASVSGSNEFEAHVLKQGDNIVAFSGASRSGQAMTVEFSAVNATEQNASHGEFLYFHMIADACKRGVTTFSFGVGDEPFKRSWCNIQTSQYNTMIALTIKGAVAARIEAIQTRAKRMVKSNKRLYAWLKNLRKKTTNSA